jgi:hypothetical protein
VAIKAHNRLWRLRNYFLSSPLQKLLSPSPRESREIKTQDDVAGNSSRSILFYSAATMVFIQIESKCGCTCTGRKRKKVFASSLPPQVADALYKPALPPLAAVAQCRQEPHC